MAMVSAEVTQSHLLPGSLPAGVSWLWRSVMFPGGGVVDSRPRVVSLLVLVVLPALLLYPCLQFRLLEPDEGRYAEIPREMLQRGDWVVPHLQGQPYLDKPPLLYWLVMIAYSVFGVSDWAARIAPALAIHATILATYWIGRRSLGERPAFWGSLLLCVAPAFMTMGRLLILDGLLTACTTVAILCAYEATRGPALKRGWWTIAAIAIGFGILTKGPVALILTVVPIVLHRWLTGVGSRIGRRALASALGLMLAVNLPWYIAIGLREPRFLKYFFWDHNVVRFLAPFDHIRPVWFYIPVVLLGMLPATLLLVPFGRYLLSSDRLRVASRTMGLGFSLIAGGWCLFFFSMSGSKLPTYILPAFPMLALAVGAYLAQASQRMRWLAGGSVAIGLALMLHAHYVTLPWYAQLRSPMGEPERVTKYCGDPNQPVVCFPRSCDSVAFYLGRDDLRNARSKDSQELIEMLRANPRTVVLFTHRHSLAALRFALPPDLEFKEIVSFRREASVGRLMDILATETPWGLCDLAVIERK